MSSEFMSKLFQPFERAQDSTNSRVTGTGLGMAITKNLIDLMNGDIRVESRPRKALCLRWLFHCSSRMQRLRRCLRNG